MPDRRRLRGSPLVDWHADVAVAVLPRTLAPHRLIVAQTGSGKTSLLRVIAAGHARQPARQRGAVLLGDGKRVGSFTMFERVPGFRVANGEAAITELVQSTYKALGERVQALLAARVRAGKTSGAPDYTPPPSIDLTIDEYIAWLLLLDAEARAEAVRQLGLIAFQGREVGIFLTLAMQTPHAKAFDAGLSPLLKLSLSARIGIPGRAGFDSVQARMLFDDPAARHRIPNEVGGALLKVGGNEVPFVAWWLPDPTDPAERLTDAERAEVWALLAGGDRDAPAASGPGSLLRRPAGPA
jgi:hypothetical protein